MVPVNHDTSQEIRVGADENGQGGHTVKIVIPKTKLHGAQFWGIVGSILGAAAIVATLLGAFFMSKTQAATEHGAISKTIGEHIKADDHRDIAQDKLHAVGGNRQRAMEHNLIILGERLRVGDRMKKPDDFVDDGSP